MKRKILWGCLAAFVLGAALLCTGLAQGAERALLIDASGVHPVKTGMREVPVEPFDALEIEMTRSDFQTIELSLGTEWKLEIAQSAGTAIDVTQTDGTLRIRETAGKGMTVNLAAWSGTPLVRITVPKALKDVRIHAKGDVYISQIQASSLEIENKGAQVGLDHVKTDGLTGKLTDSWIYFDRCEIARSTIHSFENTRGEGIRADALGGGEHEWYVYGSGVSASLTGDPRTWQLNVDAKARTGDAADGGSEARNRLTVVCPDATADITFKK